MDQLDRFEIQPELSVDEVNVDGDWMKSMTEWMNRSLDQ